MLSGDISSKTRKVHKPNLSRAELSVKSGEVYLHVCHENVIAFQFHIKGIQFASPGEGAITSQRGCHCGEGSDGGR